MRSRRWSPRCSPQPGGAAQNAALLHPLTERVPGLVPAGAVTDRLGRSGQAYVLDSPGRALREMPIVDPASGGILGLEITYTAAEPDLRIAAGDVMSYSAWMR